ncbi:hypothetical protein ACHHYP_10972 [Achlya hypogyna]|uniref:PLAC8 family protein n=1 Tax=Achlya hypogyna TaxID=1202772 RepID=A0A1V9YK78_ACHHY|nr:hypothetical protein ACHHYP_10972 [Achlya hypogyna]
MSSKQYDGSPNVSHQPYGGFEERDTVGTHTTGEQRPMPQVVLTEGHWDAPLFGCFTDLVPNCLLAFCCPCVSFAQTLARVGAANYYPMLLILAICYMTWVGAIIVWLFMWYFRFKLRRRLNIPGNVGVDAIHTLCCCGCALAQMATQTRSYTKDRCSFEAKATLAAYSDMLLNREPEDPPRPHPYHEQDPHQQQYQYHYQHQRTESEPLPSHSHQPSTGPQRTGPMHTETPV